MPSVSVVIPTLGRSPALTHALRALDAQRGGDLEVIVASDALADQTVVAGRISAANLAVAPVLISSSRPGASAARNVGWRTAQGRTILFLDDDIVPSGLLVAAHRTRHQAEPSKHLAVTGPVCWSPRVRVNPFMRWLELGIQFDFGTIESVNLEWQRFYSCNVSVKRPLLDEVGGFDELNFPYAYEDLELGKRLAEAGMRLQYAPEAAGEHLKHETLDGWRRNLSRIARAERLYTQMYPEEPAYFYDLFRSAADAPPASGRLGRLARVVRPGTPVLGAPVWHSFGMVTRQRLAGEYLAAWEAADGVRPAAAKRNVATQLSDLITQPGKSPA